MSDFLTNSRRAVLSPSVSPPRRGVDEAAVLSVIPAPAAIVVVVAAVGDALRIQITLTSPAFGAKLDSVELAGSVRVPTARFQVISTIFSVSMSVARRVAVLLLLLVAVIPPPSVKVVTDAGNIEMPGTFEYPSLSLSSTNTTAIDAISATAAGSPSVFNVSIYGFC